MQKRYVSITDHDNNMQTRSFRVGIAAFPQDIHFLNQDAFISV